MRRKIYKVDELRAGATLFIVTRTMTDHATGQGRYGVAEHLVASKHEPQPEPNQAHPYRMHPLMAAWACGQTDLWRTRRAALREAARRQAREDAHFSRRSA